MTGLALDLALGSDERGRADLLGIAARADEAGVRALWLTEGVGRDVFSVLTQLAAGTTRLELGTGIANVFARTPTMLAQSAASVLELMGTRRFNLGLGTSGKTLVEKAYGVAFDRPVTRLAETVRVIDAVFRTQRTPEAMSVVRTSPFPVGVDVDRERLRIFVAGLGRRSLQVTGRHADGWLPIWPSVSHFAQVRADVDTAAADAGRPVPEVAAYVYGVVGEDAVHREIVRDTLAWYVAGNGTAYRRLFERYGYADDVERIASLWAAGRRDEARRAVPETLLDDTAAVGDPRRFLDQVDRFGKAGVDRVVWRVPRQVATRDVLGMIDALAATGS